MTTTTRYTELNQKVAEISMDIFSELLEGDEAEFKRIMLAQINALDMTREESYRVYKDFAVWQAFVIKIFNESELMQMAQFDGIRDELLNVMHDSVQMRIEFANITDEVIEAVLTELPACKAAFI